MEKKNPYTYLWAVFSEWKKRKPDVGLEPTALR
jgi:hypothetical protein